jgi:predicted Ser/Thr protein kinase
MMNKQRLFFNNYLDHAEAYVNMSTVKDSVTNEEIHLMKILWLPLRNR